MFAFAEEIFTEFIIHKQVLMSNILCPDCNSQDVQTIEDKEVLTSSTNGRGIIKPCVIGSAILFFLLGLFSGEIGLAFGLAIIFGLPIGLVLGLVLSIFIRRVDVETILVNTYYVCRSCGREFRGTAKS